MKGKILIADDEKDISDMLSGFFEAQGYEVITAENGAEAIERASYSPDIILLDINMPDTDGFEVCGRIREYVSCPIIFLSARIAEADKLKGFAAGGDDYVIKPFSLSELSARVGAHLRREARRALETRVKFSGDLTIDYSARRVFIAGEEIRLAKKEFEIVELFSQNPGQVFDRERIYEIVWDYADGDSTVVTEHIRRIRKKLEEKGAECHIETLWGCGYKWAR